MAAAGDKGVSQRRVRFRRYQSLAQDIESFEPMVESVTNKGRQLQRDASAAEIEKQFQELSGTAKKCCTNEGQLLEALDKFADACQKFISWQSSAQEKITKGSQPSGHQNELQKKIDLLKVCIREDWLRLLRKSEAARGSPSVAVWLIKLFHNPIIDSPVDRF